MLTAGVDLAAEPKKTAVCVVQWATDSATVTDLQLDAMAARGERVDRAGSGRVVEVYPAAALRQWGLWQASYKGADGRAALGRIVDALTTALSALAIPHDFGMLIRHSDDAFDALICALVARAAQIGLVDSPDNDEPRLLRAPADRARTGRPGGSGVVAEGVRRRRHHATLPPDEIHGRMVRESHQTGVEQVVEDELLLESTSRPPLPCPRQTRRAPGLGRLPFRTPSGRCRPPPRPHPPSRPRPSHCSRQHGRRRGLGRRPPWP